MPVPDQLPVEQTFQIARDFDRWRRDRLEGVVDDNGVLLSNPFEKALEEVIRNYASQRRVSVLYGQDREFKPGSEAAKSWVDWELNKRVGAVAIELRADVEKQEVAALLGGQLIRATATGDLSYIAITRATALDGRHGRLVEPDTVVTADFLEFDPLEGVVTLSEPLTDENRMPYERKSNGEPKKARSGQRVPPGMIYWDITLFSPDNRDERIAQLEILPTAA